jgi:hypothetical protein
MNKPIRKERKEEIMPRMELGRGLKGRFPLSCKARRSRETENDKAWIDQAKDKHFLARNRRSFRFIFRLIPIMERTKSARRVVMRSFFFCLSSFSIITLSARRETSFPLSDIL